jgi:hypothetical protein
LHRVSEAKELFFLYSYLKKKKEYLWICTVEYFGRQRENYGRITGSVWLGVQI